MKKYIKFIFYLHRHRLIRYLFVGGFTFIIDFGGLVVLHGGIGVNVLVAASISYWISVLFNFSMNRFWTFSTRDKANLHKHVLAYGVLLGVNYIFTITFIGITTHFGLAYTVAKVLAVIIQTSWTYFVYREFVFKS